MFLNIRNTQNINNLIIFLSIIIHIIAPYTNIGFFAMDEHFQILEPLAYKLDLRDKHINEIWEFGAAMRPWTQVYFYYVIVLFLKSLSINDPFIWIYVIQTLLSVLGFISLFLFYRYLIYKKFIQPSIFNTFIYFLFVFNIFLHCRTSSENLSITLFIFGIYFFLKNLNYNENKFWLIILSSIFLGFSLLVRYHIIFLMVPFYLWLIIYKKSFIQIVYSSIVILIILIFGLFLDYLGYGKFYNTYYNYYYYNMVIGIFDNFGIEPWWYYISEVVTKFYPPISIFIIIGSILFFFQYPKSFITWICIFYFVIFSYLGHKELRFIFPVLVFSPIFIIFFNNKLLDLKFFKLSNLFKYTVIFFNFLFFTIVIIPAERHVHLYRFIHYNLSDQNINFFYEEPYLIDGLKPYFYVSFLPELNKISYSEKINNRYKNLTLITRNFKFYKQIISQNKNCKKIYNSYPEKIISLNKNWSKRNLNWFIIKCK